MSLTNQVMNQARQLWRSNKKKKEFIQQIDSIPQQDLIMMSKQILKLSPRLRQKDELLILKAATKEIQFFKQLLKEQDQDTLNQCLRQMKLENWDQNTILFERGQQATKFYIIIDGVVGVWVANTNSQNQTKSLSVTNKKTQRDRSLTIKDRAQTVAVQQRNSINYQRQIKNAVKLFELEQHLEGLLKVNELKGGDSFGELALINDAPRLATIVCQTNCQFAILTKNDYKEILLEAQKRKVQKNIEEISEHPGFHLLSRKLLLILLFAFQNINFKFREFVYKQGQPNMDMIYFVKEGEFVVFQQIRTNEMGRSVLMSRQRGSTQVAQIGILTKGQVFGEEEVFSVSKDE